MPDLSARLRAALIGIASVLDLGGNATRKRLREVAGLPDDGLAADRAALDGDLCRVEDLMDELIAMHNAEYHPGQSCPEDDNMRCAVRVRRENCGD